MTTLKGLMTEDVSENWRVLSRALVVQVAEFKKLRRRIYKIARLMMDDGEHPAMIRTRTNEIAEDLGADGALALPGVEDMLAEAVESAIEGQPLPPEPADFDLIRPYFDTYESNCLRDGADPDAVAAQLCLWREAFDQASMETRI